MDNDFIGMNIFYTLIKMVSAGYGLNMATLFMPTRLLILLLNIQCNAAIHCL